MKLLKDLKEDLLELKVKLVLVFETIGFLATFFNLFKSYLPNNAFIDSYLLPFGFVYLIIITVCLIIINKTRETTFDKGIKIKKYSSNYIKLSKLIIFVSSLIFAILIIGFIYKLSQKKEPSEKIKIIIASFKPNEKDDDFGRILNTELGNLILAKKIDDSISSERNHEHFENNIDTIDRIFNKVNSKKGIFVSGFVSKEDQYLSCRIILFNIPLELKNSRAVYTYKSPDTLATKFRIQAEKISELILALLLQRLMKIQESNKILEKLINESTTKDDSNFLFECLRIKIENLILQNEREKALDLIEKAKVMNPKNENLKEYEKLLNLKPMPPQPVSIDTQSQVEEIIIVPIPQPDTIPNVHPPIKKDSIKPTIITSSAFNFEGKYEILEIKSDIKTKLASYSTNDNLNMYPPCISFKGNFNETKLYLNIDHFTSRGCVKRIVLSFFDDLDGEAITELTLNKLLGNTNFEFILDINNDERLRELKEKVINLKVKKIYIVGKIDYEETRFPTENLYFFIEKK